MKTRTISAKTADFTVQNEGSIFLLRPLTPAADLWVAAYIGENNGYQPMWPTVIVEHRYILDIIDAILAEGLTFAK